MLLLLACIILEPAWAVGLGTTCRGTARTPAERYCLNYGGCPQSGNCYFPDGSYCDLEAFYRGDCPTQASIEQAMWEREMYYWLYSDDLYPPSFGPYLTPIYVPPLYPEDDTYYYPGYYPGYQPYDSPGYGSAAYWKGEADLYYLAGYYEEAVDLYTRALDLDPTLSEARLNLGHSLYLLGRYQESLFAYEAVLRIDPKNSNAWRGKGLALMALNRVNEGQAAMDRADSLTPVVLGRQARTA